MVEVLISSGLLMLLMTLVLGVYFNSHRAWVKSSDAQQVIADIQVSLGFLTNELQAASFESITITPDNQALSFLSMKDEQGNIEYNAEGRPLWNRWLIYYASGDRLYRKEVPWVAPPLTREVGVPIRDFEGEELDTYLDGTGKVLSRHLESWEVSNPASTQVVRYQITTQAERNDDRKLTLEGSIRPRN